MSLLNKLRNKYKSPEINIECVTEDIVTSSLQRARLSPEELVEENKKIEENKKQSFFEKYPDGLPREVLEQIDYTKFGGMLKQKQLLPASYDKSPVKIEIDDIGGKPRVILTFKSKTNGNSRMVSIYGYNVAYSENIHKSITWLITNPAMIEEWRKFAEYVMDYWDSYARYSIIRKDL